MHAKFRICEDKEDSLVLLDRGPWTVYPTVTNDAEYVVSQVVDQLGNRRLFYYDSEGELTELLIKNGEFQGYAPVKSR